VDSFGGFRGGVLRILEHMVALELISSRGAFLCFAVSRRGRSHEQGDAEVLQTVHGLLRTAGFPRVTECRYPAYLQVRYGTMRVYAFRIHSRRELPAGHRKRARSAVTGAAEY
jgi:hypothetical protein